MNPNPQQDITFENTWKRNAGPIQNKVSQFWQDRGMSINEVAERLNQLVFVILQGDKVIGVSTAYKVYLKQFNNYFLSVRFLIDSEITMPGLFAKLVTSTRDFLEQTCQSDLEEKPIGLVALVENERLKKELRSVVLPTGFVYVGNSAKGHHIRIYYFRGAHIQL